MRTVDTEYLAGVVEGFYGQPWTSAQRCKLFECMARWGLNTYFYAPKDDLKHRALWRQVYEGEEVRALELLIRACRDHGIRFIYGLSPGLDMRFADPDELGLIESRLGQMTDLGCRDFALLFDDLPGRLSDEDRERFGSPASAQSHVANTVWRRLRGRVTRSRLLFCPTAYCGRMDSWQLGGVGYLDTLGRALDPDIDVLWTGPEIVSREISVESIERLAERLRRSPVIWDNLHANDYDMRRLYCGPYSGRTLALRDRVRGILLNPNNEFPVNTVPLQTLAAYVRAGDAWDPRAAYLEALESWLGDFVTVGAPIELRDLRLLTDVYYLPHEEGPDGRRLVELVAALVSLPVANWGRRHEEFLEVNRRIQALFERLTELRDRELFYAWSRRAWELKEELQLIEGYLAAKVAGRIGERGCRLETHLPGTYRGGVVASLQRLLEVDECGCIRPGGERTGPHRSA